jgi:hypothetical protein
MIQSAKDARFRRDKIAEAKTGLDEDNERQASGKNGKAAERVGG